MQLIMFSGLFEGGCPVVSSFCKYSVSSGDHSLGARVRDWSVRIAQKPLYLSLSSE